MDELIVDWSVSPTEEEIEYRKNGYSRTKSTVFLNPVIDNNILKQEFIKNGGVSALQKHTDRTNNHNFYPRMIGNELNKESIASLFFDNFILTVEYKNIHRVDSRIILEYRNCDRYGMRYYINNGTFTFRGLLEPYAEYKVYKRKWDKSI